MSSGIQVFLRDSRLPTVDEWNAAIKAEGFDLVLDPSDLRAEDGYLPALLKGEPSGFEWYISAAPQSDNPHEFPVKSRIGDSDRRAQLIYSSSDTNEGIAAWIAGAVLAKLSGGYYLDREAADWPDEFLQGDEAIAAARKSVQAHET